MDDVQYCFYDRLKEDFPSQIIVDITEKCNYACHHCPHANFSKSDIYTGDDMEFELIKKLADEVAEYGRESCQQIRFTANGEPMLHPRFYEIMEYTARKSGVFVSVTTNGSALTESNIEKLINTRISLIDISLDANSEEVYSKVRVNGNFTKVRDSVLRLLQIKKERDLLLKIVVSFVKQPLNEHEALDFERYWNEAGVDYVVLRDLHTAGGSQLDNKIVKSEERRRPCVYPWERIVLGVHGELEFCPASWLGKTAIGDYNTTSIHEIWKNEDYLKLREMHLQSQFVAGHACENCGDWVTTNWPNHGRGYGDMIRELKK